MDETRREKLLAQLKKWLPQPAELDEELYNAILDASLGRTIDSTLNFLNYRCCDVLPTRLESLIVAMCVQMIKSNNFLSVGQHGAPAGGGTVASLSEGETSISFVNPSEVYTAIQATNPVTSDFLGELYNFRKLPK